MENKIISQTQHFKDLLMELHSGWKPSVQSLFYSLTLFAISWNVTELYFAQNKDNQCKERKRKWKGPL